MQLDGINGRSAPIDIDLSSNLEEFIFGKNLSRSGREGAYELMVHNIIENNIKINKWRNPDDMNTASKVAHDLFIIVILILFALWFCYWIEIINKLGW